MASLSFTAMLVCVRLLDGRYPSFEIVFFRSLVGLVFILPPLMRDGVSGLHTTRFPLHVLRAGFALMAMVFYYYAVAYLPLGAAITYSFVIPLAVTVGAALFLKEKVDGPRWIATLIGFCGILIILRPGSSGIGLPVAMALLSVVFYAGAWITMKFLTRTDAALVIVSYQNILVVFLALVPTLIWGTFPLASDLPLLIGIGLFGSFANYCQAKSFGSADASAVMPFDFLRLPFSVAGAWLLFAETTGIWTLVGAVVIFGATYYITWHESRSARARKSGETPAKT